MKNWHLVLLITTLFVELKPILTDKAIVDSKRTKTLLNFEGDAHSNRCEPEHNKAQLDVLSKILMRAEETEGPVYHVMIESADNPFCTIGDDYNPQVLTELFPSIKSKKLRNTTIENIDNRLVSSAASHILSSNWASESYEEKNDVDKEFERRLRQYYPFDLRTLTFQHVLDQYKAMRELAWQRKDLIEDEAARAAYIEHFENWGKLSSHYLAECEKLSIINDEPLYQAAIRYSHGKNEDNHRMRLANLICLIFVHFVDLNIFFKIQELEQQKLHHPEKKLPEKLIIITGTLHMYEVIHMLRRTGKYRQLFLHNKNTFYTVKLRRIDGFVREEVRDNPLKITLFGLIETRPQDLEWELQKRAWYPDWCTIL